MTVLENPVSIFEDLKMIRPGSSFWPESANVYLFRDGDGISLFDVGCGNMAPVDRLFSALEGLGWKSKPVKQIVLSHVHPDHSGALEILLNEVMPERIILHKQDLPYALEPEKLTLSFDIALCKGQFSAMGHEVPKGSKGPEFELIPYFKALGCSTCPVKPTKTVLEGDLIHIGDYHFQILHTPGHAPGHMSLYDSDRRVLLAGDIVGEMVAWYTPSSGGAAMYLESLEKVEALDIDLVLPSHGDVIQDSKNGIRRIKDRILERDKGILEALQSGQKSFGELLNIFFPLPTVQFFPGIPILESHLRKLKKEGKIKESGSETYFLAE
ncbi:MAG: MBL fold metallo-hydrolase [Desulfobacteraceae bacterium]|jgi:glyoxylase-like metal-dependent hydrolase (beta-lactamase superfamily II)